MAKTVITITNNEAKGGAQALLQKPASKPRTEAIFLARYFEALASGNRKASFDVQVDNGDAVAASRTVTLDGVVAGDSLLVNDVEFVAGTDFSVGSTDADTASNLADAINASSDDLVSGVVSAEADDATVIVSAAFPGVNGNLITLEGRGTGSFSVPGAGDPATGSLTCASVADGDVASVGGYSVTAVDKREKTQVACNADDGAFKVTTVTALGDTAGSLNNTYFKFTAKNSGGATSTTYYVWYNVDSGGTDPAVAGATGIEVDIASGASASTVGSATRTAITSGAGSKVTVRSEEHTS